MNIYQVLNHPFLAEKQVLQPSSSLLNQSSASFAPVPLSHRFFNPQDTRRVNQKILEEDEVSLLSSGMSNNLHEPKVQSPKGVLHFPDVTLASAQVAQEGIDLGGQYTLPEVNRVVDTQESRRRVSLEVSSLANNFVMQDEEGLPEHYSNRSGSSPSQRGRSPEGVGLPPEPDMQESPQNRRKTSDDYESAFRTMKHGWVPDHMKRSLIGSSMLAPSNRLNKSGIELNSVGKLKYDSGKERRKSVGKELIMFKRPVHEKFDSKLPDEMAQMMMSHKVPAEYESPKASRGIDLNKTEQRGSESKDVEEAGNQAKRLLDEFVNSQSPSHQIPTHHKAFSTEDLLKTGGSQKVPSDMTSTLPQNQTASGVHQTPKYPVPDDDPTPLSQLNHSAIQDASKRKAKGPVKPERLYIFNQGFKNELISTDKRSGSADKQSPPKQPKSSVHLNASIAYTGEHPMDDRVDLDRRLIANPPKHVKTNSLNASTAINMEDGIIRRPKAPEPNSPQSGFPNANIKMTKPVFSVPVPQPSQHNTAAPVPIPIRKDHDSGSFFGFFR